MSSNERIAAAIRSGRFVVLPTDTLYGIVCSALDHDAVERLYDVRERERTKPFIILLSNQEQLAAFGIDSRPFEALLSSSWPGPVSIILPCSDASLAYLHRGTERLAFRVPAVPELRALLEQTGPLAAPSANPAGKPPATTIDEARAYFGDAAALYVDGGKRDAAPSAILRPLPDGTVEKLR